MLECAAHAVQLVPDFQCDFQCRIFCICQLRDQPRNPDFAFWGAETLLKCCGIREGLSALPIEYAIVGM
jgi:hypothetical protein